MQASSPVALTTRRLVMPWLENCLTLTMKPTMGTLKLRPGVAIYPHDYVKINALYEPKENAMKDVIVIKIGGVAAQSCPDKFSQADARVDSSW